MLTMDWAQVTLPKSWTRLDLDFWFDPGARKRNAPADV
jgi:hypothetical protein